MTTAIPCRIAFSASVNSIMGGTAHAFSASGMSTSKASLSPMRIFWRIMLMGSTRIAAGAPAMTEVAVVPDVPAERVPEYFSDFGQTFGHSLCPVAWYFAQVEPDGEVCFCGDFPDYFIGNVRRQSFLEVWAGEKANRFREKLAKEPLPICARCCAICARSAWVTASVYQTS